MSETEWLACGDPEALEAHLWEHIAKYPDPISPRKSGLFCVACCRRIWSLLDDPRSRRAVEFHEDHLDRSAYYEVEGHALNEASEALAEAQDRYLKNPGHRTAAYLLAADAAYCLLDEVGKGFIGSRTYGIAAGAVAHSRMGSDQPHRLLDINGDGSGVDENIPDPEPAHDEQRAQADLLRDIFGNPFSPVTCDPSWRTSTVVGLAEAIYAERAFDRLPILADALEDAGCTHPDVLAHCRGDGPHARGCWVVDLILSKS